MQKIIISIAISGTILVVGTYTFLHLTKDESKIAEVILETTQEYPILKTDTATVSDLKMELTKSSKIEEPKVEIKKIATPEVKIVKSGKFNKIDPLHYASGAATVEQIGENYKIKFASNFSSADGPDLYVYLSEPQNFKNIALGGVDTSKTLNLGLLKKLSGSQEYLVSKDDFEKYSGSIVIWCKQFGVQFSRADLK